ncbi:MAG: hypothetical protein IKO06_02340 [Alphaproteobacteria bacterium]|nr:hypothetical protein [Alphaproteobacteria bacterium]
MSHYFENEDLWKLPNSEKLSGNESTADIKQIIKENNLTTEDLTIALFELKNNFYSNPDKKTAREVLEILNLAVEHPNAGVVGGRNEDLDPYKYSQYYEVESNTEVKNLATLVIQMHPDMEKDVFDIYEKLSEKTVLYHDLAKISGEHPKAMDLFEKIYNRDVNLYYNNHHSDDAGIYATFLLRAEDAMENIVNPDNVDRIERMVNTYYTNKHNRLDEMKGKISTYKNKKLENSLSDKEEDALIMLEHLYKFEQKRSHQDQVPLSLREKISKMKTKAGTIDEHKNADSNKKVKDMSVDLLADKMKFIEKRVSLFRENSSMVSREQEDKIRISAYKDFKAQSKG